MRWPFRWRSDADGAVASAAEPAAPPVELHRSPGWKALLQALPADRKLEMLDLGPAVPENIAFLSSRRVRLEIEDLFSASPPVLSPGLPRFDAVLAWDLFDYLDKATAQALAARLAADCRPGAWLFAMVCYQKEIPARPVRFKIADAETLAYTEIAPGSLPCPRWNARDLGRLLAGFRVHGTFLLRNGRQEFVFVREGAVPGTFPARAA